MRRLFLQIYLGFIAVLIAVVLATSFLWWWGMPAQVEHPLFRALAERVASELPPPGSSPQELEETLRRQAEEFGLHLVVWNAQGNVIASVGRRLPERNRRHPSPREMTHVLDDGRELGILVHRRQRHGNPLLGLLVIAGAIGAGAYPVARRITLRLERLRGAVEDLGAGELGARVRVEGRDEVADLANSFNAAAARIQDLVTTQRQLLASASHELRTPLARLRMAIELMGSRGGDEHRIEAETNIAELDELIEDLLTAARLQSGDAHVARDTVELLPLLAEEAARIGVEASGESIAVEGDERLLRRLIRNLLENSRRYGGESPIEASLECRDEDTAVLVIADRGPGVPEHERERIFEPFYRPARPDAGRERDGGAGLGLALVREIARLHGGDAWCAARAGGGTLFEVELRGVAG